MYTGTSTTQISKKLVRVELSEMNSNSVIDGWNEHRKTTGHSYVKPPEVGVGCHPALPHVRLSGVVI